MTYFYYNIHYYKPILTLVRLGHMWAIPFNIPLMDESVKF
jgi:hypothetical protein